MPDELMLPVTDAPAPPVGDVFLTLIVEDAEVALARTVAATMSPGGVGMWTTPLSATGQLPATHWISTGWVPAGWQAIVPTQTWEQAEDGTWTETSSTPGDPDAVLAACEAAGLEVTAAEIAALFAAADVTAQDPWVAMGRLGLQMVEVPEPEPQDDPSGATPTTDPLTGD